MELCGGTGISSQLRGGLLYILARGLGGGCATRFGFSNPVVPHVLTREPNRGRGWRSSSPVGAPHRSLYAVRPIMSRIPNHGVIPEHSVEEAGRGLHCDHVWATRLKYSVKPLSRTR